MCRLGRHSGGGNGGSGSSSRGGRAFNWVPCALAGWSSAGGRAIDCCGTTMARLRKAVLVALAGGVGRAPTRRRTFLNASAFFWRSRRVRFRPVGMAAGPVRRAEGRVLACGAVCRRAAGAHVARTRARARAPVARPGGVLDAPPHGARSPSMGLCRLSALRPCILRVGVPRRHCGTAQPQPIASRQHTTADAVAAGTVRSVPSALPPSSQQPDTMNSVHMTVEAAYVCDADLCEPMMRRLGLAPGRVAAVGLDVEVTLSLHASSAVSMRPHTTVRARILTCLGVAVVPEPAAGFAAGAADGPAAAEHGKGLLVVASLPL